MRLFSKILFLLTAILISHSIFSIKSKVNRRQGLIQNQKPSRQWLEKVKELALPEPGGPATPEVKTFTPLGADEMVDLFSGDFKYNIPLLDVGGYPVILNYNSNPSLTEDASMVGFGWNLNVGSIDRNVRGLPDDFSGDVVTEVQSQRPEFTLRVTGGLKTELFGGPLSIAPSATVSYNNYSGIFTSENLGVELGIKLGSDKPWGKFGAGIDMSSSFSEGFTGSASAKLEAYGFGELKTKAKWNAEKGLKEWGILSKADIVTGDQPNFNLEERQLSISGPGRLTGSGTTTFRLKGVDFSPSQVFPKTNYAADLDVTVGAEFMGIDASLLTGIGISGSYITNNTVNKSAFGYLNAHKAGESDLMDFSKSDEDIIQPDKPQLFPVFSTYDVYSINAEGLQSTVRPFRTDIPLLHDAKTESKGGSGGVGAEISGGNLFKGGANINGTYNSGENGPWHSTHPNIPQNRPDATDDACWYFGQVGLQTPELHENLKQNILQGDKPVRFNIEARTLLNRLEGEVPPAVSSFPLVPATIGLASKVVSNIAIQALTADQASRFGLESTINSLPLHQPQNSPLQTVEAFERFKVGEPREAKNHHISEIVVTNTNGSRYHFGIPVYNKIQEEYSFNVSGDFERIPGSRFIRYRNRGNCGTGNTNGLDQRFRKLSTPAYATGFLLTAILSSDFVDVTGDGPSEDDLGNYTHFKYTKISDKYRWRIPFGEQTASLSENSNLYTSKATGDDVASFTTGEKELWYINTIETRNYVAKFFLSPRNDGMGSGNSEHGRNARGLNVNTAFTEGQALMKLDKIVLYSKTRNPTGSTEEMVKTVHFEYDYSLCASSPDNVSSNANDNGKLTLKKVYFTHRNSQKSRFSPYLFYYDNGQKYSDLHLDRWQMYKNPEGGMTNDEFPYANQGQDGFASLWRLNRILLPTGGLIKVDYERDEYAFVENKKAMTMLRVAGFGMSSATTPSVLSGVRTIIKELDIIYFLRPSYISDAMANDDFGSGKLLGKMFQGLKHLYFEIPIKLGNDDPNKFETITGYLELNENLIYGTDFSYSGNNKEFILLKFNASLIDDKWHPLQMEAFRAAKQSHPALMATLGEPGQEFDLGRTIASLSASGIVGSIIYNSLKDRLYYIKEVGTKLNSEKAFCRVYHPLGRKRGGQSRVKAIRIYDNWTTMVKKNKDVSPSSTSDIPEQYYGQSYDYTLETEEGIISSGVASYEPNLGSEEIPHNAPYWVNRATYYNLKYRQRNKHFASALYPAPGVGYSKVTVKSIHSGYAQSGTGRSEHEFFTAKDFPVKIEKTTCDYRGENPWEQVAGTISNLITGIIGFSYNHYHFTASQGFSIVLNDMHGKVKSVKVFEEGGTAPIAGNQYFYKTRSNDNSRLDNRQYFIQPDGKVEEKRINTDTDFSIYTRKSVDQAFSGTLSMNLDVFLVAPLPIPPAFTFTAFPGASTDMEENFLVMTTKVVYTSGLLEKIETYNYGQTNQNRFLLADAITGSNLISSTLNRFGKPIYNTSIPAHWLHPEMGKSAARAGNTCKQVTFDFVNRTLTNIPPTFTLKVGDLIAVRPVARTQVSTSAPPEHLGRTFLYHVLKPITQGAATYFDLFDANGEINGCDDAARFPTTLAEVYILRPAEHNQLDMEAGKVESGQSPFENNQQKLNFNKVISATATRYSDKWQTYQVPRVSPQSPTCNCTNKPLDQKVLEEQFTNLSSRITNRTFDNNYLRGLLRNGNCELELWGEGVNLLFSPNATFKFVSFVPDAPRFPCEEVYTFTLTYERTVTTPHPDRDSKIPPTVERKQVNFQGRSCMPLRKCTTPPTTLAPQCITQIGENVNPFRAGISGLFRQEKTLSYAGARNYPASFNNSNLSEAGYFSKFYPYWNCSQIRQSATAPGVSDGLWIANSRITRRDGQGKVLETKDTLDRFQASLFAFKNQFPNAMAENARYHQIAYESFEDLIYTQNRFNNNECPKGLHFLPGNLIQATGPISLTKDVAHTGNYALRVRPSGLGGASFSVSASVVNSPENPIPPSCGPIGISLTTRDVVGNFQPTPGTYLVSVWVKRSAAASSGSNLAEDLSGINLRLGGNAGNPKRGPIIDGWQNIWDTLRIAQGGRLTIEITGGTREFFMDDLRVHPYHANMKSFVYDPDTYKLAAELDNNNYATFYDYDLEGNLERVKKETENGILTIKEIRFGNIKTIYESDVPNTNNPKITTVRP